MTFARPLHHASQAGCRVAGLPGGLLGDRILPVLRWSVATVALAVLPAALALWLPCVALHPASCRGEVWGPPRALRGVLGAALLCPVLCFTRTPRWGAAGAGARASTLPSLQYTCRGRADTQGASHGITHSFWGLASEKLLAVALLC